MLDRSTRLAASNGRGSPAVTFTMLLETDPPHSWIEAANAATFTFFELSDPLAAHRWSGGFGWGDGPVALEVVHVVDGVEVSVDSHDAGAEFPEDQRSKIMVIDLLTNLVMNQPGELRLPQTWTVEPVDQTIHVEGVPTEFSGIRLGDQWAGVARIGGVNVTVKARGAVTVAALRICRNWAMSSRR
jgi:hypothetical protein